MRHTNIDYELGKENISGRLSFNHKLMCNEVRMGHARYIELDGL